jgi:hypothetical protein
VPTPDEYEKAEAKALDLLFKGMTKAELLALHEMWDGDVHGFFWRFTDRLAPLAPEEFSTSDGRIEKEVGGGG